MNDKSCIMVILDGRLQSSPALSRAAALACKSDERLLLTLFEYDHVLTRFTAHKSDPHAYVLGRRQKLEEFAASLRKNGLQVESRYFWGRPLLARMLLTVLAESPQIVFKDVQAEPLLRHLPFTSMDMDLLRHCPEPLMLVQGSPGALPKRILAAVDPLDEHERPQELNARILTMANRLATQCDAQVDIVHVFEFVPFPADPEVLSGWSPDVSLLQKLRDVHLQALLSLGNKFGIMAERMHMLDGEPARAISELANLQHSDLVIMGTVQRGGFEHLAMGSVAERLLQQLSCDVLALKPDGFRERLQKDLKRTASPSLSSSPQAGLKEALCH